MGQQLSDLNISNNVSEIIEMAWCDKTSFNAIAALTGLNEADVIALMRKNLKPSSFRMWRKRVTGRLAKHAQRQKTLL
jgi:uncharacterized protein (TIGR03643 family)